MSENFPAAPKRSDFAVSNRNPFASERTDPSKAVALQNVEQQRAIAEVQARMLIARANPRDPIRCVDLILRDCTRPTLAEKAIYQYSRGGTSISGPSIRLAEAIAQRWGNIASGIKEISRSNGYSECVAYAWDLESGYFDERQFQVRHWRDTKGGGYALTDERDIYELIANMGQRRKRAVLLTVIPGDVVEAAEAQCDETLHANADTSPDALARIAVAFEQFGVSKVQLEKRCQCRLEAIRPAQVVQLRKIFTSMKDGMSDPGDWFEVPTGAWKDIEEQHATATRAPPASSPNPPDPPKPRGRPRKQPAAPEPAADELPPWFNPEFNVDQPDAPSPDPTGNAPEPEAVAVPPTAIPAASGSTFSAWLVDGEGQPIPEEDGSVGAHVDPSVFLAAYNDVIGAARPGDRELIVLANKDAVTEARKLLGLTEGEDTREANLLPYHTETPQGIYDRLEARLMACTTADEILALAKDDDYVSDAKAMNSADPALYHKLSTIGTERRRFLSRRAAE